MNQLEAQKNMNLSIKSLATSIRALAETNRMFSDICTIFAMRERSRSQVTVNTLLRAVEEAKMKYNKQDCRKVLEILASYNIGLLVKDTKGRVRALINIKYTLQSLGLAAVGSNLNLKPFIARSNQAELPVEATKLVEKHNNSKPNQPKMVAKVVMSNGNETISIPLTNEQFMNFMADLTK